MNDVIHNHGGIVITGDVYGGTFDAHNMDARNIQVTINDPALIQKLLIAAEQINPDSSEAKGKVEELKTELKSSKPKTGKLQALYDWLKRNCTGESVLSAVKVFGELLILALK